MSEVQILYRLLVPLTGEAKREYQRKWIQRRREEFFFDKACQRCGSVEGLELDHVDPSQKVSHRIWSWSKARILSETSKCQVLCHDCHLQKTREDLPDLCGRGHPMDGKRMCMGRLIRRCKTCHREEMQERRNRGKRQRR